LTQTQVDDNMMAQKLFGQKIKIVTQGLRNEAAREAFAKRSLKEHGGCNSL